MGICFVSLHYGGSGCDRDSSGHRFADQLVGSSRLCGVFIVALGVGTRAVGNHYFRYSVLASTDLSRLWDGLAFNEPDLRPDFLAFATYCWT